MSNKYVLCCVPCLYLPNLSFNKTMKALPHWRRRQAKAAERMRQRGRPQGRKCETIHASCTWKVRQSRVLWLLCVFECFCVLCVFWNNSTCFASSHIFSVLGLLFLAPVQCKVAQATSLAWPQHFYTTGGRVWKSQMNFTNSLNQNGIHPPSL